MNHEMIQNQTQGKRIARGTTIFQNSHCTPRLEMVNERDTGLCFHPPPPSPRPLHTNDTEEVRFFSGFLVIDSHPHNLSLFTLSAVWLVGWMHGSIISSY